MGDVFLASAVQLGGTVLFNVDTVDATFTGLPWEEEDLRLWTPDMAGSYRMLPELFAEAPRATVP